MAVKRSNIPFYGDSWIISDPENELREVDYVPLFLQGNEACVEGALLAGLHFYGGYPITPSSEIAEILSRRLPQDGKVFIQMEDEIASIASCIGASLCGVKSMTATSGPGFSLMQENLGYAIMTEVPTVIINVQRLGPSTGAPSSPSQGDLMQTKWGSHGDHPILALSPSSVKEAFEMTVLAFNFSEMLRTPVIILSDEVVGHMREKILIPPQEYVLLTERKKPMCRPSGYAPFNPDEDVTALAPFGTGYRYHVTGLLHDKDGFPTSSPAGINNWFERVYRKFEKAMPDIFLYKTWEMEDAEILIISYGISARTSSRAMMLAREMGLKVGFLQLLTVCPLDENLLEKMMHGKKMIVVPEMNRGQLALEIERITGKTVPVKRVNRIDGHMITPEAILEVIK